MDHIQVIKMRIGQIRQLPTLSQSQFDDLKFDDGKYRIWLSRCGREDGLKYDNLITIEHLINGRWVNLREFQARD